MAADKYDDNISFLEDVVLYAKAALSQYYNIRTNILHDNSYSFNDAVIYPDDIKNLLVKDLNENDLITYGEAIKDIDSFRQQIVIKSLKSLEQGIFMPFAYLTALFELSDFQIHCLFLCLAAELDKNFERIYGFMLDNLERTRPDVDICIRLFTPTQYERIQTLAIMQLSDEFGEMLFGNAKPQRVLPAREMRLEPRIVKYILGQLVFDEYEYADLGISFFSYEEDSKELWCGQEVEEVLGNLYDNSNKSAIIAQLYGAKGSGKKLHIKRFAKAIGYSVLFVDIERFYELCERDDKQLRKLLCETILQQALICFTSLDLLLLKHNNTHFWNWMTRIVKKLSEYTKFIFFTTNSEWKLSGYMQGMPTANIEVKIPNAKTRFEIWSSLADTYPKKLLHSISNKYSLTPGQIEAVFRDAEVQCIQSNSKDITERILSSACQRQLLHKLEMYATNVPPLYGWDDLILRSDQLDLIKRAVNYIKYKSLVFEEWNFSSKLSYGRGLTLLFSGSPGTGKTMTAQVIARELGLELYKVDLSCIISKYIGETEQNLSKIFDEASKSQCALLFDEADALFGKRTEVKDSHDRNANIEVSYLLQAVEDYDGLIMLSTNFSKNIDPAFKRRIQFIIDFTMPDAAHRKMLWMSMFPEKAPRDNIDFDFLAKKFELSGSSIKSVVISAAYDAASKGESISLEHILDALRIDMTMQGKTVDSKDFEKSHTVIE